MEARQKAVEAALAEMTAYLRSDFGQVAIFDATNTTSSRRQLLVGPVKKQAEPL